MPSDLTQKFIDGRLATAAAPKGKRNKFPDGQVRGLYLVVTDRGVRSWTLIKRVASSGPPTCRSNSALPKRAWGSQRHASSPVNGQTFIKEGKDPTIEKEAQRTAQLEQDRITFNSVVGNYEKRIQSGKRKGKTIIPRMPRNYFGAHFGDQPISSISRNDVEEAVLVIVDRGAKPTDER